MTSTPALNNSSDLKVQESIEKTLRILRKRNGYKQFVSNIGYPEESKNKDRSEVVSKIRSLTHTTNRAETCLKDFKSLYVDKPWNQDKNTAAYLLIGRSLSSLKSIYILAQEGKYIETIELSRSAQESLDLAFTLTEEGNESQLHNWFLGKTISHKHSRKSLDRAVNTIRPRDDQVPYADLKAYVYGIYSKYTHTSYIVLLETIDIFHEDIDFNNVAGFHYLNKFFSAVVKQLLFSILLQLKGQFSRNKNNSAVETINTLISKLPDMTATEDEVHKIIAGLYSPKKT